MIVFLAFIASGGLFGKAETLQNHPLTVTQGDPANFRCSSGKSGVLQNGYVRFRRPGYKGKLVLQFTISQEGVVDIPFNEEDLFSTDGDIISIKNVQLEHEGSYECQIYISGSPDEVSVTKDIIVTVKPEVEELTDMTTISGNPLVDIAQMEIKSEREVVKCIAKNAKPKPTIKWQFDSAGLNDDLSKNNSVETIIEVDGLVTVTSIFKLKPEKMYDGQTLRCIVSHSTLGEPIRKAHVLNVEYAPGKPTIRPNLAQQEVRCDAIGNPEPRIIWLLPDNTTPSGSTVKMQDIENDNATYKCTAENDHGTEWITKSNRDLREYSESINTASLPMIIGIACGAIAILVIIGILIWRYVLDPREDEKMYQQNEIQYITDDYRPPPPNRGPPYETESDDEGGMDEPIFSQNAARYHQQRRSASHLRHSPSRGQSPQYQNGGKNNLQDEIVDTSNLMDNNMRSHSSSDDEEDELIDDPHKRYNDEVKHEDYIPGGYYETNNHFSKLSSKRNNHGSEIV